MSTSQAGRRIKPRINEAKRQHSSWIVRQVQKERETQSNCGHQISHASLEPLAMSDLKESTFHGQGGRLSLTISGKQGSSSLSNISRSKWSNQLEIKYDWSSLDHGWVASYLPLTREANGSVPCVQREENQLTFKCTLLRVNWSKWHK